MHEKQVNGRYHPQALRCWQVQLDHALHAALHTDKQVATYWIEEAENLAGRIAIVQARGTNLMALPL